MARQKVALVTGAQRGIGKAIAVAAARRGYAVAINFCEEEDLAHQVSREIEAHGRRAVLIKADVSNVASVFEMVDEAERRLGPIDVLVNNAGIFPRSKFLDLTEEIWDDVIAVNLKSTCFVSQATAKSMIRNGQGGCIINMASSAVQGVPFGTAYVASKCGIIGLTRTIAVELGMHNIRVNAIAPGLTNTAQPRQGLTEEQILNRSRASPMGQMAEPEDVAEMAAFLMSDGAAKITGQTMHVNCGDYRP